MDLNHFHLQVNDVAQARRFYETFFEFSEDFVCDENEVFLKSRSGFYLGLEKRDNAQPLPSWFHFGFELDSETAVHDLYKRMLSEGVKIQRELKDFGDMIQYYCVDPDNHRIEIYFKRN